MLKSCMKIKKYLLSYTSVYDIVIIKLPVCHEDDNTIFSLPLYIRDVRV